MGIRSQNNPIAAYLDVFSNTGTDAAGPNAPQSGLTATGGVISDYTDSGSVYRAHIFTSSGTFDVTALGNLGNEIEYLVVGGGGGGGGDSTQASRAGGGGGGAGGLRSTDPAIPAPTRATALTAAVQSYPVVVGAGGAGGPLNNGGPSSLGPISVLGGGGANNYTGGGAPGPAGNPGGSGGGGSGGVPGAPGVGNGGNGADVGSANQQGFPGGTGYHVANVYVYGGGGGGASAAGTNAPGSGAPLTGNTAGNGGDGYTVSILGPTLPAAFAGGGGGGAQGGPTSATGGNGGLGGGGAGVSQPAGTARTGGSGYNAGENYPNPENLGGKGGYSTGGGGGGSGTPVGTFGGHGGSGIVVARYKIGTVETGDAKATGGNISFYNNKTIHVFTTSGTFVNPAPISNVEVVMVAGGGAGGNNIGGGGGAGAVLESPGTGFTFPNNTYTITVGAGGAGIEHKGPTTPGFASNTTISYPGPYTWTAQRGGHGATYTDVAAQPGGSGGAGVSSQPSGGSATAANSPTPIGTLTAYGNNGGTTSGNYQGAGGGGAGGNGSPNPSAGVGGAGGVGRQLPATFQNPDAAPSNTSDPAPYQRGGGIGTPGPVAGGFYVAGGGGGAAYDGDVPGNRGLGGAGGGGDGAWHTQNPPNTDAESALENTGSGGGGAGYSPTAPSTSGSGGSGIVLIAYPS